LTKYVLPELQYDYGALEPEISGQVMELHHDKHHRAYVEGANKAMEQLSDARSRHEFSQIGSLERALAFNASGHVLHSIFWRNLTPDSSGRPRGQLSPALDRDFGSFALFKQQMIKTASTIMGSGWAALVYDPLTRRLGTTQIHDHQSDVTPVGIPLLVIDAWEHAYYLQYQTEKVKFFEALWSLWNWQDVEARYELVQRLDLGLAGSVKRVNHPRSEVLITS
jgi:superoxide dismutase, Fe-Mn family